MSQGIAKKCRRWIYGALLLVFFAGCAGTGPASFQDGQQFFQAGNYDRAVVAYTKAVEESPDNPEYMMRLSFAKARAAMTHKERAEQLMEEELYEKALTEYQIAAQLDSTIEASAVGIDVARDHVEAVKLVAEGEEFLLKRRVNQAKKAADLALQFVASYPPAQDLLDRIDNHFPTIIDGVALDVTSTDPMTLNFKKVKLTDAFKILSDLTGINFILDEDIRSKTTTLFLEDATFAQALELMLSMNKLDKKILNAKTIILFKQSKDKKKQFGEQVIQTFYLSNIDAKKAVNLLRTILQLRKVYVHEELNAVVVRDSPEIIRLCEKVLEANDRASAEVIFDLELIEVSHNDASTFGPKLGSQIVSVGLQPSDSEETGTIVNNIVVDSVKNLSTLYSLPASVSFDLIKNDSNNEVLANPKIRVRNKEKAKVHIGSREPVVTVTINGDQTSENVQYVDVGVKMNIEPTIQLDDTVITKLGLEVSNANKTDETDNGTTVLTISTTNADTVLTLKDGEQTVLGGLIRTSDTLTNTAIPILGDLPLLGKLFTNIDKSKVKREILLSITPHIVKSVNLPQRDVTSLWSGGEDDFKNGRNFGSFAEDYRNGQSERPANPVPALTPRRTIRVDLGGDQGTAADDPAIPAAVETEKVKEKTETPAPAPPAAQPVVVEDVPEVSLSEPSVVEADQAAQVFLLGSRLAKVGVPHQVVVIAEAVRDLHSAPMYINYDQNLLDFVSIEEAGLLKRGSETNFTHSALPEKGQIIVGLKRAAGVEGVDGGGGLFTLTFTPKATGLAEIMPDKINLQTPQGLRIPVAKTGLTLEVTE